VSARRFVVLVLSVFVAWATQGSAHADEQTDAVALVSQVHEKALQLAQLKSAVTGTSQARVIRAAFDGGAIGRVVLGAYWESASDIDRAEFIDALLDAIARSLAERLTGTTMRAFEVLGTQILGNGDVLVKSRFDPSVRPPIALDWRVRRCPTGPCISDVFVDGASVAVQQRDDVAVRLAASGGSMTSLIADLREDRL
jgi:phospholipid transport system substrate-binding protein